MIKCELVTVANTSYQTLPDIDFGAQGAITLNRVADGAALIYASFDGVTDAYILAFSTLPQVLQTTRRTYQKVWFKTASGSPKVSVTCES